MELGTQESWLHLCPQQIKRGKLRWDLRQERANKTMRWWQISPKWENWESVASQKTSEVWQSIARLSGSWAHKTAAGELLLMTFKEWCKEQTNASSRIHAEIIGMDIFKPEVRWRFLILGAWGSGTTFQWKMGADGHRVVGQSPAGFEGVIWCRPQGRRTSVAGVLPNAMLLCCNLWESLNCQTLFPWRTGDTVHKTPNFCFTYYMCYRAYIACGFLLTTVFTTCVQRIQPSSSSPNPKYFLILFFPPRLSGFYELWLPSSQSVWNKGLVPVCWTWGAWAEAIFRRRPWMPFHLSITRTAHWCVVTLRNQV